MALMNKEIDGKSPGREKTTFKKNQIEIRMKNHNI